MEENRKYTDTIRTAADRPNSVSARRRKHRRKRRRNLLPLIITTMMMVVGFWMMTKELVDKYQSRKLMQQMAEEALVEVTQPEETQPEQTAPSEPMEFAPIAVNFSELWQTYPDLVAWLYCPTNSLNYPVVQTDNNQFYMDHLPNGKESAGGSLFVDCTNAWDFSDTNTVIYGHDMKDGSMFGYLHNYDSVDYYEKHGDIYLLTPSRNYRLEILSTAVVPDDSWLYQKKMGTQWRKDWAKDVYNISLVGTQNTANLEAEHYVTLSTCSYEYENARFVVVASLKKIY